MNDTAHNYERMTNMKFVIVSKGDERSNKLKQMMKEYLLNFDLIYDKEEPELVISVGGDGTILEAFHRYVHRLQSTAFVGVHTGHLGFYADWIPEEIEKRSEERRVGTESRGRVGTAR